MIQRFPTLPIMTAPELRAEGIHPRDLAGAVDRGELIRAARGIYVQPDIYTDPRLDDAIVCHKTGGVIGYLTAAMKHGLCDALPPHVDMIVPIEVVRPPADLPVRLIRTRNEEALSLGVDHEDFHGLTIRMTNEARTVVDLFRITPDAVRQHSAAALVNYLSDEKPVSGLYKYAKAFGIWDVMRPQVEAVMETLDQGFRR